MRYLSYLAAVVAACTGCAAAPCPACPTPPQAPAPAPCPTASAVPAPSQPDPVGDLAWVAKAQTLRIERGRSGRDAAWVVHYELTRRETQFDGMAVLTATRLSQPGAPRPSRQFRSGAIELNLPAPSINSFLETVARASPRSAAAPVSSPSDSSEDHPWWLIDIVEAAECAAGPCAPPRTVRLSSPRVESRPSPWFLWRSELPVELEPGPLSKACDELVTHLRDEALRAHLR